MVYNTTQAACKVYVENAGCLREKTKYFGRFEMTLKLIELTVGPWPMNMCVLICEETNTSAIVDPGADPDVILKAVSDTKVDKILLTHAHMDHVGALEEIKSATGAPVYLHPAEHEKFGVSYDLPLNDGDEINIGNHTVKAIHTPGHTPGMISFDIGENRIVVGDTIFVNGPGRTWSHKDFLTTMETMKNIVFRWPDETRFYPGHGPSGTIGRERVRFEAFLEKGWPEGLQGDVTWE